MTEKKTKGIRIDSEPKKLVVQGDTYITTFNKKYTNRKKWVKPNEKEIISYIPGTIKQILVKAGDKVKPSDKLIVLEAMKMMNNIFSPIDGTIRSIHVNEGDCVPRGTLMIILE